MRNEAVDGMPDGMADGMADGTPGGMPGRMHDERSGGRAVEEPRAGAARVVRRRAAGPRPVRPAAASPAVRPLQPMRPAGRAVPVAVVVPLFGGPARERVVARLGAAPAVEGCPPAAFGRVRVAVPAEAVRRFLAGLALMVVVAIAVVLLGLVAAAAGEARGGAGGEPASTVMVSPDGAAATR